MIDLRTLGVFLRDRATAATSRWPRSASVAASRRFRRRSGRLEEELGVVLIDRTTRPMLLTPSGAILREHAHRLIQDTEMLVATVRDYGHAKVGEVRLGLVYSFAAAVGPALTRTLLDHAVGLTLWSGLTSNLAEAFLQRKVDMIIGNDALDDVDGLVRFELMSESYLLLAPADVAIE